MGAKSLPFAVLNSQRPGCVVGIVHGIGLGPVVGKAQVQLVLGQRRGAAVGYAKSPNWRYSGECGQAGKGKRTEATHTIQNAQNRLLFPQPQVQI